tara:strand:- start:283 stop:795 length:513 start_codon:yes stop_codon:yes gene_type:complete
MDNRQIPIDSPIPGMGMTAPLGGRPWQQPPQLATVEDAMEYYMSKLSDRDFVPELLTVIELGVPLTTLANTMQLASVMEGKHSIDVGILVIPVLVELMANLAEQNDIPHKTGLDPEKDDTISPARIALAKKKGKIDLGEKLKPVAKEVKKEEPEEQLEQPPMGLMSRREQ